MRFQGLVFGCRRSSWTRTAWRSSPFITRCRWTACTARCRSGRTTTPPPPTSSSCTRSRRSAPFASPSRAPLTPLPRPADACASCRQTKMTSFVRTTRRSSSPPSTTSTRRCRCKSWSLRSASSRRVTVRKATTITRLLCWFITNTQSRVPGQRTAHESRKRERTHANVVTTNTPSRRGAAAGRPMSVV